jgi:dual specificity phosphatase 12
MNRIRPATEIIPGLFLGNRHTLKPTEDWLAANRINVIISVLSEEEYEKYITPGTVPRGLIWHRLAVADDESEQISAHFQHIRVIIRKALSEGKRVLVHCSAGVSRSPTLVAAYLMLERGYTSQAALAYIQGKNHYINPNPAFRQQLAAASTALGSPCPFGSHNSSQPS